MKKFISTKTGGIIFLTILALPFLLFSPVADYVDSRYAEPRECTLESVNFQKVEHRPEWVQAKTKLLLRLQNAGLLW